MYQALLASGDHKSAKFILKKIPADDRHVCAVIKACKETYKEEKQKKTKKKKNKWNFHLREKQGNAPKIL